VAIALTTEDATVETRAFVRHDGILYAQPLLDWAPRHEVRFFPEAPGSYVVEIEWRRVDGSTGWVSVPAEVSAGVRLVAVPRTLRVDARTELWVPSEWESLVMKTHEASTTRHLDRIVKKDAVVYDVGANLGLYSALFCRLVGPGGVVYAFEANPVCLYFLQVNRSLNRLDRLEILPLAVLDCSSTVPFTLNYRNLLVGNTDAGTHMNKPGHTIGVPAVALDDVIEALNLRPPDVVKIDIEGAESAAVLGMRSTIERYHPAILVEIHGQGAAHATLDAPVWSGYDFLETTSGKHFENAADLRAWFPNACLQVVARHHERGS